MYMQSSSKPDDEKSVREEESGEITAADTSEEEIEVVKKPSPAEEHCTRTPEWRCIGEVEVLKQRKCHYVQSRVSKLADVCLIYLAKENCFKAMETWCSHMHGPLHRGDIEDYDGSPHIKCPWHAYLFNINTGVNPHKDYKQKVFEVKVEDGNVYVLHKHELQIKERQ